MPTALTASLADVASMSLEERFQFVLRAMQADIEAALRELCRDHGPAYGFLGPERLAWAIAFNVTGEGLPLPKRTNLAARRSYLDKWPGATPWGTVWQWLKQPVAGAPSAGGGLTELAASVACECRNDWQYPGARPIRTADAQRAFTDLYSRHADKVTGYVQAKFGPRAGDPQDIASEAWARVFVDYWSATARRRVLGGAALSTLVCGVAYYIAADHLRRAGNAAWEDAELAAVPTPAGQADDLARRELARHVRECRKGLPARQQIAARLVWDHELPQREVALRIGNTDAAVSQLLKRARENMAACLEKWGYSRDEKGGRDDRHPRSPR